GQPLDAEEISVRELSRHFAKKRSIAAPKIDLQRRAASEKLQKIETRDLQFRQEFDHSRKMPVSGRASTPAMCVLVHSYFEVDVPSPRSPLPSSKGERIKVRGFHVIASTSLKSSLTLPLSLAKGEATPDGRHSQSGDAATRAHARLEVKHLEQHRVRSEMKETV